MTLYTSNEYGNVFNTIYPNKCEIDNLKDFKEAVSLDHVFGQFNNNTRSNQNFQQGDILFADVDNTHSENPVDWITIDDFKKRFIQYNFYLATSKNHQKIKNGMPARDKYHIYFPIHKITDVEKLKYWLEALTTKYTFFDKQVKDAGRFFNGNPNSIIFHSIGKKSIIEDIKGYIPKQKEKHLPHFSEITTGNRNDSIFRYACSLHNGGASDDEIRDFIDNIPMSDKLSDKEIDTIIKSVNRFEVNKIKTLSEEEKEENKKYVKNYKIIETGETDQGGNKKYTIKYPENPQEFDEALEHFISFKDGSGKKFMLESDNPENIIQKTDEFAVKLINKNVYMDFKVGGITESRYMEWVKDNCLVIERMSCTPEIEEDKKTKYIFPKIDAVKTGYFRNMIELMTFKTIKDRYRFAAGLLSAYLPSKYDGRKPLFSVLADSSSSGKTSAVRIATKCCQGQNVIELCGEKEDEQQISGIKPLSNKYALYDNLQYIDRKQLLTITKSVTDSYIPAWFFGVSHARVRNNKTYWATFNSEESINTDVLNRIITIHMKDGRDVPENKKLELNKLLEAISNDKIKVMQDIRWAMEQPVVSTKVKHHPKFVQWGEDISKLLKIFYPEIEEFDFSLSEEDKELSADSVLFDEFIQDLLGNSKTVFIDNDQLVEKYRNFYRRPAASKSEVTRKIKNMQKSFTDKYTIDAGTVKKVMNMSRRGVEIIDIQ